MNRKILILFISLFTSSFLFAQNCQASFTYTVDSAGTTVSFVDQSYAYDSLDYVTSWYWDFGDSIIGTSQNETHTYNTSGVFYACLTINTADSCSSTFCDSVFINSPDPCAGFYVTGIVTNESTPSVGDGAIDITVYGGTPPFSYFWNNGSSTSDIGYLYEGQYCVTVTDNNSCSFDTCFQVNVDNPATCSALFSYSGGTCPNCIDFTDQSTASNNIISWSWDFGNGNYSSLQNPQQTFLDSGNFVVSLTIITDDSCSDSFFDTVFVNQSIQTFSVSGQIFADTVLLPSGTAQLFSSNFSETHPPFYSVQIQNGDYLFPVVASGNYKLMAVPDMPESNDFQPTYFGDKTSYSDAYVLSVYSDLISVDIHLQPTSNGIEYVKNNKFKVYPNPANTFVTFKVDKGPYNIEIYNVVGENILEIPNINSPSYTMQRGNFSNGIYIYKISNSDGLIGSGKLIFSNK